jgi:uncharacterized protein (DUF58 family)
MLKALLKPIIRIYRWIRHLLGVRREYKITLEGILFILVTFFIGFAAINTNTNLLYLIMSMMLSFFILSGFLSTSTLRSIEVMRLAAHHISALEDAMVQMEIRNNKKRMSSYSLRVMDYLASGELVGGSYLFHVGPRSRKILSYKVRFPRRGIYELDRIRILTRFPFGFFERALIFKQPQEILVYPQIIDVKPVLEGAKVDLGEYETGKKGHGHSLYGLREYAPGDGARYIHWKVSARTRKIMVREFEKEEKKKVTLFLGNSLEPPISSSLHQDFEKAVVYTASLAKYLIDREFQIQLVTASGYVPFGLGTSHLYRILRALAIIQLEEKGEKKPVLPALDAESTNVVIHFDPCHSPSLKPADGQVINVSKLRVNLPAEGSLGSDSI